MFISLAPGQSANIALCRYIIESGTSATVKLKKNGSDVTGFTAISVTTTAANTDAADVALADNDKLTLEVTAIDTAPVGLSFTMFVDYSKG